MNKKVLFVASVMALACACQPKEAEVKKNPNEQNDQDVRDRRKNKQGGGCCGVEKPQAPVTLEVEKKVAPAPNFQSVLVAPEKQNQEQATVSTPEIKVEAKAP